MMITETLQFGKNIITSNIQELKKPYKITFSITDKCNSQCKNCNIGKKEKTEDLPLSEIKKFFEENNYLNWIDLTGGEIFLREDIDEILEVIITTQKNLHTLHFPTNGILTEKIVKSTKKIKRKFRGKLIVSISLDGDEKTHDGLRGVNGNFQKALNTYKKLTRQDIETYFGYTISEINAGKLAETINAVKTENPNVSTDDFHINLIHHSKHYYQNQEEINYGKKTMGDLEWIIKNKKTHFKAVSWLEKKYLKNLLTSAKTKKTPIPCTSLSSSCFIQNNGDIYPCSIYSEKIGNIQDYENNLENIYKLGKTRKIREKIKNLDCPNCFTACDAYPSILGNLRKTIL